MAGTTKPVRKDDQDEDDDKDPATSTKPAQATGGDDEDDDTDWKAESRKWERRAKAARREADQAAAAKPAASDKADDGQANERIADAERKAKDAERRALVAEVALDKGLSLSMARRLVGTTREELEDDADDLLKEFGFKSGSNGKADSDDGVDDRKADGQRRSKPKEDLRPGASRGDEESETVTPKEARDIADRITAAGRI